MSDRPDDLPRDTAGPDVPDDLAAVEAALTDALEHRAGGPLADADGSPLSPADDERFAAVEASVAAGGTARRVRLLGVAAAAVVVLVLGSIVLVRADRGAEVTSVGNPSTTADPQPSVPGTVTTVGTAPDGPVTTVAAGDLAGLDPGNLTFPASACADHLDSEDGHMPSGPFTLVDGVVTLPLEMADGRSFADALHISLDGVVLGDVTSDGREDAVLTLQCAFNQSDGIWPSIVIVSAVDGTPTVLGTVAHSGFQVMETIETTTGPIEGPRHEFVLSVAAADGNLAVRWNQTRYLDPGSEQRHTTVTYEWDGRTFVPLGESDVEVIPAQQYVPPAMNPVESFDFSSMMLTLDRRMRAGSLERVACGVIFQDVQPVDVQLVDGAAVVRDDGGNELGTVSIESVDFANLDDDDLLEALVRLRCTHGSVSQITLAVYEATAGPADLLWSTTDFAGITGLDDVVQVEAGVAGQCPLIISYRASAAPDSGVLRVAYRRDVLSYVEDPARCTN